MQVHFLGKAETFPVVAGNDEQGVRNGFFRFFHKFPHHVVRVPDVPQFVQGVGIGGDGVRQILLDAFAVKAGCFQIDGVRRMVGGGQDQVENFFVCMLFDVVRRVVEQHFVRHAPGIASLFTGKAAGVPELVKMLGPDKAFHILPGAEAPVPENGFVP